LSKNYEPILFFSKLLFQAENDEIKRKWIERISKLNIDREDKRQFIEKLIQESEKLFVDSIEYRYFVFMINQLNNEEFEDINKWLKKANDFINALQLNKDTDVIVKSTNSVEVVKKGNKRSSRKYYR